MAFSQLPSPLRLLLSSLLALPSVTLAASSSQFKTCYWPDGSIASDESPCGDGSGHSACCGNTNDVNTCLNGGLCMSKYGHVVRHACTDPTWSDSACPKTCTDRNDKVTSAKYVNLVSCDSFQLWACYNESLPTHDQCAEGNFTLPFIPEITSYANVSVNLIKAMAGDQSTKSVITVTETPESTNESSSSSDSTGSASTSGGNGTANSGEKKNTTSPVVVGAGVGVPLGIAFLAALGLYIFERRHAKRLQNRIALMEATGGRGRFPNATANGYNNNDGSSPGSSIPPYGVGSPPPPANYTQPKYEVQGQSVQELPYAHPPPPPQELPTVERQS